jgi:hypothetical protein
MLIDIENVPVCEQETACEAGAAAFEPAAAVADIFTLADDSQLPVNVNATSRELVGLEVGLLSSKSVGTSVSRVQNLLTAEDAVAGDGT